MRQDQRGAGAVSASRKGRLRDARRFSLVPEFYLARSVRLLRAWGALVGTNVERGYPLRTVPRLWLSSRVAGITLLLVVGSVPVGGSHWGGRVTIDALSVGAKVLLTGATTRSLWGRRSTVVKERRTSFEYPLLRLYSLLGRRLLVSATDLLRFYLALELQSLCLYVLAAFRRGSSYSTEAGLKYFVLGAFASGLYLFGCSLVYGARGTTQYESIGRLLRRGGEHSRVLAGFALRVAAVLFKRSAAPYHRWAPDVREGSPTPSSRFFGAVTKVAAVGGLLRWCYGPFQGLRGERVPRLAVVARLSRVVGALGALRQRRWKRFLAYSTVGHRGYLLRGRTAATVEGLQGRLLYRAVYVRRSVSVWTTRRALRSEEVGGETKPVVYWSELVGLGTTNPGVARTLAVGLLSRAGVPPRAGFRAKARVFRAARNAGLRGLSLVAVASAVVGAYYYLRVLKVRYFEPVRVERHWVTVPQLSSVVRVVSLVPTALRRTYPQPRLVRTHYVAVRTAS